jgi:lipid II:glycine glycyltransferase (peptidoglycan interpeptide bridge formation enzyme)
MGFMDREAFRRLVLALGENGKLLMAEYDGIPQSYSFFAFSAPCAYWMYGGNIEGQHPGAMKLLQWETIRSFRTAGVRRLDFYGARVDPPKGSKQEGINLMKKHLGASLLQGYMWKYPLRPWAAWAYSAAVKVIKGGDIVDQEARKLHYPPPQLTSAPHQTPAD